MAAVAATAAIVRRNAEIENRKAKTPAAVAATAAIVRRLECGKVALDKCRCRSRRDCGNREAVFDSLFLVIVNVAAVAATAAIVRRVFGRYSRQPRQSRSRRDCGNREAGWF